jgi:hydroxymethylpyrimidine/phosphomethylpyrimidine kinase
MAKVSKRPVAMTIAGSDPGGGAGLQADLKTFAAHRVYGFAVITAVIAQNSAHVTRVEAVSPAMVAAQIATIAAERRPDALKTGALSNDDVVRAVADSIRKLKLPAPVVDPVLISSSGARLLDAAGEHALQSLLIPLARVVTPNIPEAESLTDIAIDGLAAMRRAARALRRLGADAVVIKGGHPFAGADAHHDDNVGPRRRVIDLLFDGRAFTEIATTRIPGDGAHGTGCAFSAAIAAGLARGDNLPMAVRRAQTFVARGLRARFRLAAHGRALLDHFAGR